jgi:exonuclease SbcC
VRSALEQANKGVLPNDLNDRLKQTAKLLKQFHRQLFQWAERLGRAVKRKAPNEAVSLGIAIYNMRQGEGIRYETLFRDETVGALDAVNGKEYVRMLRSAMDLGGFHQVIFICQTPLVRELADQILVAGDGHVVLGNLEGAVSEPASVFPPLTPNNGTT